MSFGLLFFLVIAIFMAGSLLTLRVVSKPKNRKSVDINVLNKGKPPSDI